MTYIKELEEYIHSANERNYVFSDGTDNFNVGWKEGLTLVISGDKFEGSELEVMADMAISVLSNANYPGEKEEDKAAYAIGLLCGLSPKEIEEYKDTFRESEIVEVENGIDYRPLFTAFKTFDGILTKRQEKVLQDYNLEYVKSPNGHDFIRMIGTSDRGATVAGTPGNRSSGKDLTRHIRIYHKSKTSN